MTFSERNLRRCEAANGFGHKLESWSLSDWMTAVAGEVGEAANIVKKLNRVRDGIRGNAETPEKLQVMLGDELADIAIYIDLMAQRAGFDLTTIRDAKFSKTSRKIGYVENAIAAAQPTPIALEVAALLERLDNGGDTETNCEAAALIRRLLGVTT